MNGSYLNLLRNSTPGIVLQVLIPQRVEHFVNAKNALNQVSIEYTIYNKFFWFKGKRLLGLTLCYTGGVQSTRTCRWSCMTPRQMIQMSSYFMTLFLITFPRTPWGHFSKKILTILKIWKKVKFSRWHQRVTPFDQNQKNFKICGFFSKNHSFSSWIWILHVLSFFWCI